LSTLFQGFPALKPVESSGGSSALDVLPQSENATSKLIPRLSCAARFWLRPGCGKTLQRAAESDSINLIETGVLHEVGLRNTLEPDPDNAGVGSFRSHPAFLNSRAEFSCFVH
jgi:hypothetical protein